MNKRCFSRFMLSISFLLIFSLSLISCTPRHVSIDVTLDGNGNVVFSGYRARIDDDYFLRRDLYIFSGLHVDEDGCVDGDCNRRSWEVFDPDEFKNKGTKDGIELPASITYGKSFSKLKGSIKAKPLKMNIPYSITIGFRAIDRDLSDEIRSWGQAYFMLTKDKGGATILKQKVSADEWKEVGMLK